MFTANELSVMISDIFLLHQNFPKKPEKAYRKFDGCTPYGVHPTLLAMLILHEESLSEQFRVRGAIALLAHDLIEDTTAPLPAWCSNQEIIRLIQELTFGEEEDPAVEIWSRSDEAVLLKFYDVVSNLMCVGKMKPTRIEERRQHAKKHLAWVKAKFPQLEIIKIADGLLI